MTKSPNVLPQVISLLLIAAAAGLAVSYLVARQDDVALGLVIAALLMPWILFVLSQALTWREPYAGRVCVVLIVLLTAVFRTRDIDDKSVDLQVVCKLACLAVMALLGISAHFRKSSSFNSFTRLGIAVVFISYIALECFVSVNPSVAVVEASSNLVSVLFIIGIAERLGPRKLLDVFITACVYLCVLSFVVYFVVPELGRMTDWVKDAYVVTSRLVGVFGTANGAGLAAAFCLLATILFRRGPLSQPTCIFQLALFTGVLLASNNRMGIIAFACALTAYHLMRRSLAHAILLALFLVTAAMLLSTLFSDELLVALSRSGSAEEITSGTGRTQIWSVVLDLWSQRPLLGYGTASAKFILPHNPLLFGAAAHAHSLYLNVLFAGGAIGAGILLTCLCKSLYLALSRRFFQAAALVIFFLIYGLTEPIIGGIASFFSMSFGISLVLAQSSKDKLELSEAEETFQQRLSLA